MTNQDLENIVSIAIKLSEKEGFNNDIFAIMAIELSNYYENFNREMFISSCFNKKEISKNKTEEKLRKAEEKFVKATKVYDEEVRAYNDSLSIHSKIEDAFKEAKDTYSKAQEEWDKALRVRKVKRKGEKNEYCYSLFNDLLP